MIQLIQIKMIHYVNQFKKLILNLLNAPVIILHLVNQLANVVAKLNLTLNNLSMIINLN